MNLATAEADEKKGLPQIKIQFKRLVTFYSH
jgi:hypothetical protein